MGIFKFSLLALLSFVSLQTYSQSKEQLNLDTQVLDLQCKEGLSEACLKLGSMYYAGYGIDRNYDKSALLYGKACEGGELTGCALLGLIHHDGLTGKQDYKVSVELYKKSCEGGIAFGCYSLGKNYLGGVLSRI